MTGRDQPEQSAISSPRTAPRALKVENASQRLLVRVSAFAVLAVGMDLWLIRHFGVGLEKPWALVGITTVGIGFSGVLDWFLENEQKKMILAGFRSIMRRVLTTPLLVLLYIASFVVTLTVSSITVVPVSTGTQLNVKLTKIGQNTPISNAKLKPNEKPFRKAVTINPYGGHFLIDVEGYLPKTVRVVPLFGLTINPDEFLEPLPSVLFRPTVDGLSTIRNGGTFVLYQITGDDTEKEIARDGTRESSFLLGREGSVPSSYFPLWDLELTAAQMDPRVKAQTMLAWRDTKLVKTGSLIHPGVKIRGVVYSKANKPVAKATAIINRERFIDVKMQDVP